MKAALSYSHLGAAYGISGQAVRQLSIRHGIDCETLQQPDALLTVLLDRGNRSPLRSRLTDPAVRAAIQKQIHA